MQNLKWIILDFETNGYAYNRGGKVVEIGILEIDFQKLEVLREFSTYVNPETDIYWRAKKVHGIKEHQLIEQPKFPEIADKLSKYLSNSVIIAHNGKTFDILFLLQEFYNAGIKPPANMYLFDTLLFFKEQLSLSRNSIDSLLQYFGIELERGKHAALDDCKLVLTLLNEFTKKHYSVNPKLINISKEIQPKYNFKKFNPPGLPEKSFEAQKPKKDKPLKHQIKNNTTEIPVGKLTQPTHVVKPSLIVSFCKFCYSEFEDEGIKYCFNCGKKVEQKSLTLEYKIRAFIGKHSEQSISYQQIAESIGHKSCFDFIESENLSLYKKIHNVVKNNFQSIRYLVDMETIRGNSKYEMNYIINQTEPELDHIIDSILRSQDQIDFTDALFINITKN